MSYDVSELRHILQNPPPYPGYYKGRGIVIAGGGRYLVSAWVAIRSLRHVGCTLPIQLWYLGNAEFPEPFTAMFARYGAEAVNAHEIRKIHSFANLEGWQSKPYSIVYSPFEEVLSFDADNFALQNPEFLFDSQLYRTHGVMTWPDFYTGTEEYWHIKPGAWEALRIPKKKNVEIEAGQLLVNKRSCWRELQGALHMNERSDFYYEQCTYGDKDTYTLAWMAAEKTLYTVPHQAKLLEDMIRIHYDPNGQELFQHGRKWVLPAEKNLTLSSYRDESMAKEWVKEFEHELRTFA